MTDQDDHDTPLVPRPESFLDRAYALLSLHEGNHDFMYLDTAAIPTIGVGCALPYLESALLLPFMPRSTIVADYAAVKALPAGKLAPFYEPHTISRLSGPAIRKLFDERSTGFLKILQNAWFQWHVFPEPAQLGLFDMAFNLGPHALLSHVEWPTLNKAVEAQDWPTCAAQSHRKPPVSDARNLATAKLFLEAAHIASSSHA